MWFKMEGYITRGSLEPQSYGYCRHNTFNLFPLWSERKGRKSPKKHYALNNNKQDIFTQKLINPNCT
jgi:hypothetical protein